MRFRGGLLEKAGVVGVLVIGVLLPNLVGHSAATLGKLDALLALAILAVAMNIVLGFAGQLFLGPTALFAAGGYLAAYLAIHYEFTQSLVAMCVISVSASLVLALIIALPALRIGGFYLGMTTLYLALVITTVASRFNAFGAEHGLSLYASLTFEQRPTGVALYELGVGILALVALYSWLIRSSRLGRRLSAVRASDVLAQSVGIAPYRTKLAAFLLAAVPSGIAGAFYVYSEMFIVPNSVSPNQSIDVVAGLVIGGSGTILGPIIGVAGLSGADQFFGGFEKYQGLVYGGLLIVVAAVLPSGAIGTLKEQTDRFFARTELAGTGLREPGSSRPPTGIIGGLRRFFARSAEPGLPAPADTVADDLPDNLAGERTVAMPGGIIPPRSDFPPLVVHDAHRAFGGVKAVAGLDLTIEPGKVHALVGPNGSGKTTALNLICGYFGVDSGEICIGEDRLDNLSPDRIARMGIARTFQTPRLLASASPLENVVLGADRHAKGTLWGAVLHSRRSWVADRESTARALSLLRWIGVDNRALASAEVMSHGTQRLVEIARAISLEPKYLLLDEPAAGLSIAEVEVLSRVVRAVANAGLGVLLIEHNLPVVFGLADQVTVLHQGRVIAAGSPAEVSVHPDVIDVYLGHNRLDGELPVPAPTDSSS